MRLAVLERATIQETRPANPANRIAAGLTGRPYLSYSQITLFQKCPLRWYFEYVEGLPAELVGSSLVFGGAIHAAIERLYGRIIAGQPAPPVHAQSHRGLLHSRRRNIRV